jgi:hypothetical protein
MSDKRLMHIYSNELFSMGEAECLARNIRVMDDIYITKQQSETTGDDFFLVVRYPRQDEIIEGNYQGYFSQEELTLIKKMPSK